MRKLNQNISQQIYDADEIIAEYGEPSEYRAACCMRCGAMGNYFDPRFVTTNHGFGNEERHLGCLGQIRLTEEVMRICYR